MQTQEPGGLDIAALEAVYDRLAQAIDSAGETHAQLFLVKLALLNAQALGDAQRFARNVDAALQDLQPPRPALNPADTLPAEAHPAEVRQADGA